MEGETGDLVLILDSTDSVIGFVMGAGVYDEKGVFVAEIKPEATIEQIRGILLGRKLRKYAV